MIKTGYLLLLVASVLFPPNCEAEIIEPITAAASSQYNSSTGAENLIAVSHLSDNNEHIATTFGSNWLARDGVESSLDWVYIDLGELYSLDEIRIWNYHEDGGAAEVAGRSTKGCSVWVGGADADLPAVRSTAGTGVTVFAADKGWGKVWQGDLKQGPSTVAPVADIGPTKVLDVSGNAKVRYVGIDVESRWGKDAYTSTSSGLSYIQVTGKGTLAFDPFPDSRVKNAELDTELSWKKPGLYTPSGYELYLSNDRQKVSAGDPSVKITLSDADGDSKNTRYVPDGDLLEGTEYFWRVDPIVQGKAIKGRVWSFMTTLNLDGLGFEEIVFVKRKPYSSDHNYTMAYNGTSADRFRSENGIYIYNLKTKKPRPIIMAADMPGGKGVIGKYSLSFDAKRVVFDYRRDVSSAFRIWEVNVDGTGLRQLTFAPKDEAEKVARYGIAGFHTDDIQPCYLPDGGIAFTSSRCEFGVLCFFQPAVVTFVLHRMDADGGNIEQLTQSPVSEFSPTVLDDGRILYHRWEYIDKGARVAKTFWAMNPDGSKSEELFGLSDSEVATGAFMYAQQVPGDKPMLVCAVGPHYPQGNSVGPIKLIDLSEDNRTLAPLTNITPDVEIHSSQGGWVFAKGDNESFSANGVGGLLYGHPYPINDKQFLVSHKDDEGAHYMAAGAYSIYLIDTEANKAFVYGDEDGSVSCWHAMPLLARETPALINSSVLAELEKSSEALCIVTNVYEGMEGVERGTIKYLRINEAVPQFWDTKRKWAPKYHSSEWSAALWPRVQWGIVPVEKDGSAYFYVPADRNVFFQSLDENFMEVQRERTYVNYRPGEIRTCIGCHERSSESPRSVGKNRLLALKRLPSVPGPMPGEVDARQVIDYPADIQPIFDSKCISCHGDTEPDGDLDLTGTITERHSVSYEQIRNKGLAGPILAEFVANDGSDHANMHGGYLPPKSLGSYKSGLVKTITTTDSDDPHHKLLTQAEMLKIIRWVDSNYQFFGSYYGRHHIAHKDHPEFRRKATFEEAISPIAPKWHN